MIEVQSTLVHEDVVNENFVCNLNKCKGICCIEGDSGAPLERDELAVLDEIYPPEMPAPPKKRIRPEWILAAIALLAAAALAWVAILCRPYYKAADDPEALVVRRHHEEMTEPPVSPMPPEDSVAVATANPLSVASFHSAPGKSPFSAPSRTGLSTLSANSLAALSAIIESLI